MQVLGGLAATAKNVLKGIGRYAVALEQIGKFQQFLKVEKVLLVIIQRLRSEKDHNTFGATFANDPLEKKIALTEIVVGFVNHQNGVNRAPVIGYWTVRQYRHLLVKPLNHQICRLFL